MPYIDVKVSVAVSQKIRDSIHSQLTEAINLLHRPSDYLMLGFSDNYPLYMGSQKIERGGYISISFYGAAKKEDYEKMTARVTDIFVKELELSPSQLFITYQNIENWGLDGHLL